MHSPVVRACLVEHVIKLLPRLVWHSTDRVRRMGARREFVLLRRLRAPRSYSVADYDAHLILRVSFPTTARSTVKANTWVSKDTLGPGDCRFGVGLIAEGLPPHTP